MTLRAAIVHDDLTQRGGAERVVLSLSRLFPGAPVFTAIYDPAATYPEFGDVDVRPTFLQRAPKANPRALLPLYPAAIRSIDLSGYDVVISSTSRFAHGVRVPDGVHVTYCHNPARFLYQPDDYFGDGGPVGPRLRRALTPVLAGLRRWDQAAARRPDGYVANSRAVAQRIENLYGRVATVVNPPLDLGRFETDGQPSASSPASPFYLMVSRLLPYKRADLAVEACARLGRRLVVVGSGPAEQRLRSLGGDVVEFRTDISDAELTELLAGCTALIQPGLEDFGFAPLEANAAGRPAIAFGEGGALETVVDGETGVLFAEQDVGSLIDAVERCESRSWDRATLRSHAESMGEPRFHRAMQAVLTEHGAPITQPVS